MTVKLLYHTPLWVCSTAIRKCWASEGKSDSYVMEGTVEAGPKDKELIHRVGNKNKHSSTLEHLNYTFDIDGISRACLQELARHRHASMSVKSTRYTLKELKTCDDEDLHIYYVQTDNSIINEANQEAMELLVRRLNTYGIANDLIKYNIPEAYKTSLVWTINARSLQNFLELRTSKAALWEIRELAYAIYHMVPDEHKYLFEEFLYKEH